MKPTGESSLGKLRVFVALPLNEGAVQQATSIQARLPGAASLQGLDLRLTPADQFHVTLAFLGEIASGRLERVRAAVTETATTSMVFRIRLEGLVAFPSASRARVVGLALGDASGSLAHAAATLHTALRREGFELEDRAFRPHLTLARLRRPARFDSLALDTGATETHYVCDTLAIYRSELGAGGARYQVLHSAKLATGRHC